MSPATSFPLPQPAQSLLVWYQLLQKQPGFIADPMQAEAVGHLHQLQRQLIQFKQKRRCFVYKWLNWPAVPRGVYMYGGVGRGKTLLMDAFFACMPYRRKRRTHFHAFMQEIQHEFARLKGYTDPITAIAGRIAKAIRLLCLDELQISDIADAMILGRLFSALFARGVVLVLTSNDAPDNLYLNGLQRMNFLPTISLLKSKLDVLEINGGADYRLRMLEQARVWLSPIDQTTEQTLAGIFVQLAGLREDLPTQFQLNGRLVQSKKRVQGMVWFTFAALCMAARSQADYLFIAQAYRTLVLSDIPVLTDQERNAVRRFTWLVDILYEHHIQLIVSSEVTLSALYTGTDKAFARTRSRLEEMQSKAYLAAFG